MSPQKTDRVTSLLFAALSTLVSILFAGNVYFVSHTLEKIDIRLEQTERRVGSLKEHVAVLATIIDNLKANCRFKRTQDVYPEGLSDDQGIQKGNFGGGLRGVPLDGL